MNAPPATTEPAGPLASPGYWLLQAAQRWKNEFNRAATHLELTHAQFQVLAAASWLDHMGAPPTQQEIAAQAGYDRMMTSRIISELDRRGLLQRDTHGRTKHVQLTRGGREVIDRATAIARALDRQLFLEPREARSALQRVAEAPPPGGP